MPGEDFQYAGNGAWMEQKLWTAEEFEDNAAKARITFSKIRRSMGIDVPEGIELKNMLGL